MLTVEFDIIKEQSSFFVQITGHADTDEYGKDLVCASASILAYTLAQEVAIAEGEGYVTDVKQKLKPGDTVISCKCTSKKAFSYMLRTFTIISNGFLLLQNDYPQNVVVKVW